jgi:hypothetical protein
MPWLGGGGGAGAKLVPPSTVYTEPRPCHGKRLTCPARCFWSQSYTSENGGRGGGDGGCSLDCTELCVAYF